MNEDVRKAIDKVVNMGFACETCEYTRNCQFGIGNDIKIDFRGCLGFVFADGARTMLQHLASIPLDEAIDIIRKSVKEEQQ